MLLQHLGGIRIQFTVTSALKVYVLSLLNAILNSLNIIEIHIYSVFTNNTTQTVIYLPCAEQR